VQSPWGNSYFGWPKDVKPVAFTIVHAKKTGAVTVSAPGIHRGDQGGLQGGRRRRHPDGDREGTGHEG
jgi:hypothetical protein